MPDTATPPESSPRPIVVGVDGSPTSYQAVSWAAAEAAARHRSRRRGQAGGRRGGR
ncbi:universal stress protein [Nocardia tengchongensis]|uniref:universal stress protein n=1 Tax=Nocardia tengchongensis TaxID=2055889 RepID=UPI0033F575C4